MNEGNVFDLTAVISLFVLIIIIGQTLVSNYFNRDKRRFWAPDTFVCLVFAYYALYGPLYSVYLNDLTYRGIDVSHYYSISWAGAAVNLLFFKIAYGIQWQRYIKLKDDLEPRRMKMAAIAVLLIGLAMHIAWGGMSFSSMLGNASNTSDYSFAEDTSTFGQYLMQGMMLLILPVAVFVYLGVKKQMSWEYIIPVLVFVFALYVASGFRFRLVILLCTLLTTFYLMRHKRINVLLAGAALTTFVLFMGVMEIARNYQKGLDLTRLEGVQSDDITESSANEARICMVNGVLMEGIERQGDYAYFKPILNGVLMPLPYKLFPWKRNFMLEQQNATIERHFGIYSEGIAYMTYGEAFAAFGWFGIAGLGIFMGWLSKIIWNTYRRQEHNIKALLILAIYNGFLYSYISRGYFAQNLTGFFFVLVIPLWLFCLFAKRRSSAA